MKSILRGVGSWEHPLWNPGQNLGFLFKFLSVWKNRKFHVVQRILDFEKTFEILEKHLIWFLNHAENLRSLFYCKFGILFNNFVKFVLSQNFFAIFVNQFEFWKYLIKSFFRVIENFPQNFNRIFLLFHYFMESFLVNRQLLISLSFFLDFLFLGLDKCIYGVDMGLFGVNS